MSDTMRALPLHHVRRGQGGEAVVILHGLLGSSRNWRGIAAQLAPHLSVYTLDLRNHGSSPHSGPFTLAEMANDLRHWLLEQFHGEATTLVGHSLGGKVAMKLACQEPELVRKLAIVDISSEPAPRRWGQVFAAMQSLDLSQVQERRDAEAHLETAGIADWAFRKFISSSLEQDAEGRWRWKIGLDALAASADQLVCSVLDDGELYEGPTLLIRGGKSDFVPDADLPAMRGHFPNLELVDIEGASHNIHIDAPQQFAETIKTFACAAS